MKNAAAQAEPIANPSAAFWEGAFVGEPQVPATFERSASAAEYPPAGGPAYTVSRDKPKALRAFGLFTESIGVRLMNLLSF